jgi:hypothetical protein
VIQVLKRLQMGKEKRNNLNENEEIRLIELNALLGVTQYLIDDNGQFHFFNQKINTFQYGNEAVLKDLSNVDRKIYLFFSLTDFEYI